MKKKQAPTTFTTDAHGRRLAHVALANTCQRATLYADDLERLLAAGFSAYWQWCKTNPRFRYVLVYALTPAGKRRTVTVARLIAGAGKGRAVEYIDGDRSNLRRDNLRIVRGSGRTQTPADAVLPCRPCNLPGTLETPQGAAMDAPTTPAQHAPCTESAKPEKATTHPVVAAVPDAAPAELAAVFAHRVVDRAALSARVRQQLAQQQ